MEIFTKQFKKKFKKFVNKRQIQTNLGFSVLLNILLLGLLIFKEIGIIIAFFGVIIIRIMEENKLIK